jgi:sugar phosphate isomerase/epimerase
MADISRRDFLRSSAALAAGGGVLSSMACAGAVAGRSASGQLYDISLAQWSLHRALQQGRIDNLDFATLAGTRYGVDGVEYVNQFFKDKARDMDYLGQMKQRAADAGVRNVLIMCDGEGALGDPDEARRTQAVENHYRWVEAAKFLGCHSIRVNAQSRGSYEEQMALAADGLHRLGEFGGQHGINVIVENHGGLSSNADWLSAVIERADHPRVGTLPDFGNFRIGNIPGQPPEYDRYEGVRKLMRYARGASAKTYDFDAQGNETTIDYTRMMRIVLDAGYRGFVGIEYEGDRLPEEEGIVATKRLLERVRAELAGEYA